MLKKRLMDKTSFLFYVVISFYLIQALVALFSPISPPVWDFTIVLLLLVVVFVAHLVIGLKRTVPLFMGVGFLFHTIGLYKIIPYNEYYVGTLYGAPQLNYHYDWIVHSVGWGFLTIALVSILYPYLKQTLRNPWLIFSFLVLLVMGFGALNEIIEFMGFTLWGYGEGFMEFGEGDSSPYGGPWNNSMMDMVSNLVGAITFIGVFMLDKKYGFFRGR